MLVGHSSRADGDVELAGLSGERGHADAEFSGDVLEGSMVDFILLAEPVGLENSGLAMRLVSIR
jgi:hypothetical protein